MFNLHLIASYRPSRSLTGLACAVAVACAACGLLTPSADGSTASARLLHQQEVAQRELVWSRLFPEGPALASSLLYLDPVLDDTTPWSHHVVVADAGNGAVLGLGGLHLTQESDPITMVLAQWLPETPDSGVATASFVSGVLIGASGEQRAIFATRLEITISTLSLIAPVEVDVLVPLSFPEASRHGDAIVRAAALALFGPAVAAEDSPKKDLEPGAGTADPGPDGKGPGQSLPPCVASAWSALVGTFAALWVDAGITGGDCFHECLLDPDSGVDGQTRVRSCLPACGLGFLAGGEGSMTWAWSDWGVAIRTCEDDGEDSLNLGAFSLR
jgi:hypothetical protein